MTKTHFDDIASLYTEKVWKDSAALNEMAPPFEPGESPGSPVNTSDPSDFKAFTQPQYKGATRGISERDDFQNILQGIIKRIGKVLLDEIEAGGGRVEDSRQEMNERAGRAIMKWITIGSTGKPLFQGSHAKHLGRNVVDALVKAGHLKEVDSARGRHKSGGGGGVGSKSQFSGDVSFGDAPI